MSLKHYKTLMSFGVSIVGNSILDGLVRKSDDFLIGYFLGPTMLGYYAIGYRFLMVMTKLLTNITTSVAFPMFSRIQHDPERIRRAFYKVTQYTSLIAFPMYVGAAVLALPLIGLWLVGAEVRFGLAMQRLTRRLDAEGQPPQPELPRRPSGGVDRQAADALFEQRRHDVVDEPADWRRWYRLAVAYDAAGDRRRARAAMRTAIARESA